MGTKGNRGGTGRPPKSTKLHLIQGTYRKDRHSKRLEESEPEGDGRLPPPPPEADDELKAAWENIRETISHRIYTRDDIRSFQTFAGMWATWLRVNHHVMKHGVTAINVRKDGYKEKVISPEAKVWMDLNGKLLSYFARYGMTPADRARVRTIGGKNAKKENPEDEFAS